jgi:hypothetical protein
MGGRRSQQVPADLSRAAERFRVWRRMRVRGTRIPDPLWDVALALAGKYGLSRTAAAVKVGYYALKKRIAERPLAVREPSRSASAPTFVELPSSPFAVPGECVIEFGNASGETLRVRLQGHPVPDLISLSRSFWEVR